MIRITKEERAIVYKAYPKLEVPRTTNNKYFLSEEEKYLRLIPKNADAKRLLDIIDRRRELVKSND